MSDKVIRTCENCYHWDTVLVERIPEGFGKCYHEEKFVYDRGLGTSDERFHKKDVLVLYHQNYEEYYNFATGKDFGCIHFKPNTED